MKIYQNPDPAGFRQAGFRISGRISGFLKNRIPDIRFSVKIRPDPDSDPDIRYSPTEKFIPDGENT